MHTATRLNKKPIFIVSFARGGSNIVFNLLRSHPDVVSPRGELQQIFRGKLDDSRSVKWQKRINYLPIMLSERSHVLRTGDWTERKPLNTFSRYWLDSVLWKDRFKATGASDNRYREEGVEYTRGEIAASRLLVKNVDGLIFLSTELASIFPDAIFVGLVRNGYATCESRIRRGGDLDEVAQRYATGVRRMREDSKSIPNFKVFRYEDVIDSQKNTLREIAAHCQLDLDSYQSIRLETKKVVDSQGGHRNFQTGSAGKDMLWYSLDDYFRHFITQANQNQIDRLSSSQVQKITDVCGDEMRHYDYEIL